MNVRSLTNEEVSEIKRLTDVAEKRLDIQEVSNFAVILDKIKEAIDQKREDKAGFESAAY